MTHTKHRKRRERAQAAQDALIPGMADLRRMLAPPTLEQRLTAERIYRTGRAG